MTEGTDVPTEAELEEVFDKIMEAQDKEIAARYGRDEAGHANYGWFTQDLDDGFEVATKVYGPGMVLVTTGRLGRELEHEWRER